MIAVRKYQQALCLVSAWTRLHSPSQLAALDNPNQLRKEVQRCRTILWYQCLRHKHRLHSARAMQRFFDLASVKSGQGQKTKDSSIYGKYGRGLHKPTRATLSKVETVSPGSSEILNELLWDVLVQKNFTHNKCQRLLKRLPGEIKDLIFAKDSHSRLQRVSEAEIISRLSGRYDIATLTAYTILSREAIDLQDWPTADLWSRHLFLVLLGLCRYLKLAGIGPAILTIYESLIFSRTIVGAKRYLELPERLHSRYGSMALTGFKDRRSIIPRYAKGPVEGDVAISFDDCITSLKMARKKATNIYKGLPARLSKHAVVNG